MVRANRPKRFPTAKVAAGTAAALLICLAALELTGRTHIFRHEPAPQHSSNQNTKGEPSSTGSASGTDQNSSEQRAGDTFTDTKGQSDTPPASGVTLLMPSGNFVSTHRVSLGTDAAVGSSCETTKGATCQISFVKDGMTKQLPAQVTDDGGAAYWTWTPKGIGLTAGFWDIQAKAVFGGSDKSASDALKLEVTP